MDHNMKKVEQILSWFGRRGLEAQASIQCLSINKCINTYQTFCHD